MADLFTPDDTHAADGSFRQPHRPAMMLCCVTAHIEINVLPEDIWEMLINVADYGDSKPISFGDLALQVWFGWV